MTAAPPRSRPSGPSRTSIPAPRRPPPLGLLTSNKGYVVLDKLVDPDVAKDLRARFPEIAEERREDRQYPAGTLAANVIGTATWDADERKLVGRVGLESSQNNTLAGS